MNINKGDYLTCKNSFYEGDEILNDGSVSGTLTTRIFRKPIFKKGGKYLVKEVEEHNFPVGGSREGNTSGLYFSYCIYHVDGHRLSTTNVNALFYTTKELRKIKLKRIEKEERGRKH
jgi:hypothetical protein